MSSGLKSPISEPPPPPSRAHGSAVGQTASRAAPVSIRAEQDSLENGVASERSEPVDEKPTATSAAISSDRLRGGLWVLLAAALYTGSNVYLRREAIATDPVWVSCLKAVPVSLVALAMITRRRLRGLNALPPRVLWLPLIVAGVSSQLGGNVAFQHGLAVVGLAMTVPLTFTTILLAGAVMGRVWLGEPITPRALGAMAILIAAIFVLSFGAADAQRSVAAPVARAAMAGGAANATSSVGLWLAVGAACASGIAYAASGVVIRRGMTSEVPVECVMVFLSVSGLLSLAAVSVARLGPSALAATPAQTWWNMLAAGSFNAMAFFAFSYGMRHISVIYANAINSTQTAMAALAGILLFGEAPTLWLGAGVGLTIAGLGVAHSAAGYRHGKDD